MKKSVTLAVLSLAFLLSSCYKTEWTVIANSADLDRYDYATMTYIAGGDGSAALTDLEFKVYNALSTTRLQVVGYGETASFSDARKERLAIVRVSSSYARISTSEDEFPVVCIDFVDYMTGKPLASCKGSWRWGLTERRNMTIATEKAIEEMKKLF